MCESIALPPDEESYGALRKLCSNSTDCTLDYLDIDKPSLVPENGGPDRLVNGASIVATAVFDTFKAAEAAYMMVEDDYFDLDYRSEYSATHEMIFRVREPSAVRLHFFSRRRPGRLSLKYQSLSSFGQQYRYPDGPIPLANQGEYLGYVIIRPQSPGIVGRSMITTNVWVKDLAEGRQTLSPHIRTAVTEHVQVFGVSIVAVGVPFMEQDGHLLRCAHVSAWQCHYSAVLRGLVQRRSTASFHRAAQQFESYGRSYPSNGLSTNVMCTALRRFDLPPEVIDRALLISSRPTTWADSEEFKKELHTILEGPEAKKRAEEFWTRANIGSSVCRYLNSGIPVIISRDAVEHTKVILGYLRKEDLKEGSGARSLHSDVAEFIVSDDQKQPYGFESVNELVLQTHERRDLTSIIVPLSHGLILDGATAERAAIRMITDLVNERITEQSDWSEIGIGESEHQTYFSAMTSLAEGTASAESNSVTIRTYAMLGRDLKDNMAARVDDKNLIRRLNLLQLPKYVWVAEAIDRKLRANDKPPVVATIVMDASDVTVGYRKGVSVKPLLAQLPGQASVIPPVIGWSLELDDSWFKTSIAPYPTGRYSHTRVEVMSSDRFAGRAKSLGSF